tara:strand:- start:161 stop:355 length:195 start_codon:yes stop_codon:yes gene_type:complete
MTIISKTAEQRIAQAIAEKAVISFDHETRAFVGFRFQLSDESRSTVVRVHKNTLTFKSLSLATQ